MRRTLMCVVLLAVGAAVQGAEPQIVQPYERATAPAPANHIDELVLAALQKRGIGPADECSDAVFLRRAYIDVIGTLPTPEEVASFTRDSRPEKRAALIDALMERPEFADYWSLKWCDILRVKSEFPINLWPEAAQVYHRWVHDAIRDDMPYDQFARALLTSSGSDFRVPPANFYRAVQERQSASIAEAVALTFMGVRTASWPEDRRDGMAAFFSRIAYKPTAEWKEEIVCLDPSATGPLKATFPDGTAVTIPMDKDPRQVFADWLIRPDNPYFARCVVNRIWYWLMGRGIVDPPDDARPDNPPSDPQLLDYLAKELVDSHYDLRHIYRLILNSRTYQQSPIPRSDSPDAAAQFACYQVRRLDAEVLIDALDWIAGPAQGEEYENTTPEPYTFIPQSQRTIALADGSITSPFLEMFGRPPRDTGLESERNNAPSTEQRLQLLNSSQVQQKIARSPRLLGLAQRARGDRNRLVAAVYVMILSRQPTPDELSAALHYMDTKGVRPYQAVQDLAWALINTKEFLYRH
jgi:hypothetical protein